jgi:hypothetical protein
MIDNLLRFQRNKIHGEQKTFILIASKLIYLQGENSI